MSSDNLPKPLGDHALIIGAGSGLGLELAKVLAPTGTALAVTVRNTVDPTLEELDASIIRGIDVAKDGPDKLVEALAALGWVHVSTLVCVAGILKPDRLGDLQPDNWRQMMDVCALGPLRIVDALVTAGLLTAGSKVGLVTSEGGSIGLRTPKEGGGNYGHHCSKAAENMAGKILSLDLAERGMPLVCIHPGTLGAWVGGGDGGGVVREGGAAMIVPRCASWSRASGGAFFWWRPLRKALLHGVPLLCCLSGC